VEQFTKASPGLPICISRDELVSRMNSAIERQMFHDKFFEEMPQRKASIYKVLQNRGSVAMNIESWERMFAIFPQSQFDPRYCGNKEYTNGLKELFAKYFGDVQVCIMLLFQFCII
jgi:hypothetical protein